MNKQNMNLDATVEFGKFVSVFSKEDLFKLLKQGISVKNLTDLDDQLMTGTLFNNLSDDMKQVYLQFLRKELAEKVDKLPKMASTSTDVGAFFAEKYCGLDHEELHVVSLDNGNRILGDDLVSKGGLESTIAEPRQVFRTVLKRNAAGFFMMHNHPSGKLNPSPNDIKFVKRIQVLSKEIGIDLIDNFIVSDGKYLSFGEQDLI